MGLLTIPLHGVPLREMPMRSNWATHETYKQIGQWLKEHTDPSATVFCAAEIGALAFFSDRQLINEFSDMNRMSETILSGAYDSKPVVDPLLRLNYYWRRMRPPMPAAQLSHPGSHRFASSPSGTQGQLDKTLAVSTRFNWLTPGQPMFYWFGANDGH
jgi:hypothetical protein